MNLKWAIVPILLAIGITAIAQVGENEILIAITSDGKAKISQTLFPKTYVSTINVGLISEEVSNLLATDENNLFLGTNQNAERLGIATLGASQVDLKYNADVINRESGIFKLKYDSDSQTKVVLPPLSKLVSINTIPIEIKEREYTLPPGDISLSYSIRPVTTTEHFVTMKGIEHKIQTITAAKIEELSAAPKTMQFITKDKAVILTIIPKQLYANPASATLNGEEVDFSIFHQNNTHSWVRIDPHEKGLVKINDYEIKEEQGGGCLIATAAFGTELSPQVQFLREIRENKLQQSNYGSSFLNGFNEIYYSFSPTVADWQRENPMFRDTVRAFITPMVSSLSIMTLADQGSESQVLGLGISIIALNLGLYITAPAVLVWQVKKRIS